MLTTSRIFIWIVICFFFFKQKTAYEMRISDWSSDVCSSELVGMLHLVDRLFAFERGEACDAPIVEHAIMQQILVDRGQLVLERIAEEIDDFFVALHGVCLVISSWEWSGRFLGAATPSDQGEKGRKNKENKDDAVQQ